MAVCWLAFLYLPAYSQTNKYHFTAITSKDGLSSNTVNAIIKDRYGFIWFGTEDGLTKFDGLNYTVYRHNPKDTTSLWANEINCLFEDKTGQLWIGTSGSLHLYNRKKNNFRHFKSNSEYNGFTSAIIKSVCRDYLGQIWVATLSGLNRLDPVSGQVTKFQELKSVPVEISSEPITTVFEDSHRRMWIGAKHGLYLYERNSGRFIAYSPNSHEPQSLAGGIIKAITEDARGNVWFGTAGGLSKLLPDGKHFQNITTAGPPNRNLSSNMVYALAPASNNSLWIGTEQGLNVLNLESGIVEHYLPNGRDSYSLSGKSVRCILIDKQGINWLGTYVAGVNKCDRNLTFFSLKKSNPYDINGLSSRFVTSFAAGNNKEIYIGTDGGGLNVFNTETELFKHIKFAGKNGTDLSILALARTRDGSLWIGTFQDGLFRYNPLTGAVKQFLPGGGISSINHPDIFCLKEDRNGRLWIGTNGGGVNIYDPKTKTFKYYVSHPHAGYELSLPLNGYMRDFEEDQYGRMWIASHGSGIAIYDPRNEQFSVLSHLEGNLTSDKINLLYRDHHGNMWAGSGDGLIKINVLTKKTETFSETNGLADEVIHKILEDDFGRIWFSTNKGISWLDPVHKTVKNYNTYNGLQSGSFEQGAGFRDKQGILYFGGIDGFNYIQPKSIRINRNYTPIVFTDIQIGDRFVTSADADVLTEDISVAREIRLNYKQNFSISFVGLNYTSPKQNKYYYRLKGFDKDWINAGGKTTAYYTNLSPGNYVFQVKGRNSDGLWNKDEKSITLIIKPPFWMTIYAYLFYALVAGSLLLYIRYRGIQKLKIEFKQEEAKREAERLHELDKLKIKFLTNLSHDFRTPIALIMAPVDKLLSQKSEEGTTAQLRMIKRNTRRLLNIVNQLFDFRTIEERELKLNLIEGDVIAFLREVGDSFQDLSEKKRIMFVFKSVLDSLVIKFDPDKLERILFNLLSNAFKFTLEGGKVMLSVYLKHNQDEAAQHIVIEVADTGIGMDKNQQEHIFNRFYQNRLSGNIFNPGSGIGLSIVKEFVELHGGKIELKSEPGNGSTFCVTLPAESIVLSAFGKQLPDVIELEDKLVVIEEQKQLVPVTKGKNTETLPVVLVVEDNEDFRFYLKDNLSVQYKVIEAADGKEGWQKALAVHPELIVSDVMMPHMDGIEFSMKLKSDKRTSHIPVILLTASSREEAQINGLLTGANDFLTKPFDFEILDIKIKNILAFNRTLRTTYTKQVKVNTADIPIQSAQEKFLTAVVAYIEENLNNVQLSVEDLSRHMGMSRGSLYNKLLEVSGLSPVEFIRSIKLEKAAQLLEKSDMNIAQIAYAAGFTTPNYFAKSFKSKYQMLPSEYLNNKRKFNKQPAE